MQQQVIGLRAATVGDHVVGLVEVDPVDFLQLDEVLDLDRARELGRDRRELVVLDDDVALRGDLVAAHDFVVGDLLVVGEAEALGVDARVVGGVEMVEVHRLRADGAVELHGHAHEPEVQHPPPHRPVHDQ